MSVLSGTHILILRLTSRRGSETRLHKIIRQQKLSFPRAYAKGKARNSLVPHRTGTLTLLPNPITEEWFVFDVSVKRRSPHWVAGAEPREILIHFGRRGGGLGLGDLGDRQGPDVAVEVVLLEPRGRLRRCPPRPGALLPPLPDPQMAPR